MRSTILNEIQNYHNEPSNFNKIEIDANITDIHTMIEIERNYAKYLQLIMQHFPYVLKLQFAKMLAKEKTQAYKLIKSMITEYKIFNELKFEGRDLLYPSLRTHCWYEQTSNPKNKGVAKSRISLIAISTSLMKLEYFLKTGNLIFNASHFLDSKSPFADELEQLHLKKKTLQERIQDSQSKITRVNSVLEKADYNESNFEKVIALAVEKGKLIKSLEHNNELLEKVNIKIHSIHNQLPNISTPVIYEIAVEDLFKKWRSIEKFFKRSDTFDFSTTENAFSVLLILLESLKDRRVFFENISWTREQIKLNFVFIHNNGIDFDKYPKLMDDINEILNCFKNPKVELKILTENKSQADNIADAFKIYLLKKSNSNNKGFFKIEDVTIINTKINQYEKGLTSDELLQIEEFETEIPLEKIRTLLG